MTLLRTNNSNKLNYSTKYCGWLLIIATFLTLSGCKVSKKDAGLARGAKAIAYLRKTPCYGKCQAYEATYYDNGQVLYVGTAEVPLLGTYLYEVPKVVVADIQNKARRIKYHKMKKEWMVNVDLPTTITRITYDKTTSEIKVQGNAPDDLRRFQENLAEQILTMTREQPGKQVPDQYEQEHYDKTK